jgi:hypothetical protein
MFAKCDHNELKWKYTVVKGTLTRGPDKYGLNMLIADFVVFVEQLGEIEVVFKTA